MQLTRLGVLFLLLTALILGLGTWLPGLSWIALFYALTCLLFLWVDFLLAGSVNRIEATRLHSSKLSLGTENTITLTLRNLNRFNLVFWVRDEAPEAFRISQRIFNGVVKPGCTWQSTYTVTPLRRGDYHFNRIVVRWQGPLGWIVRQAAFPSDGNVKVYPNLLDIERYDLMLRRSRLQEIGLRSSRQRGQGTDYERLREYLPDDDFRRIDWKATARRGRPITVDYETERSQSVFLMLDSGRMMQSPVNQIAKLDYVINAALILSYVALGKGDRLGLLTFSDRVEKYLAPGHGRGHFNHALELLYSLQPRPVEPDYSCAFNYLAHKHRKRSLVVLFTDLVSSASLEQLARHAVVLQRSHLLLVVTLADQDIIQAAHQLPHDTQSAYQRIQASRVLDERNLALETLHRRGALILDTPADRISAQVINQYLDLKARTLL